MGKAKVLTLEQAIEWGRENVWIQLRYWSCALKVHYCLERMPWLRFRDDGALNMEIQVRGDMYGITWRCFDEMPEDEDSYEWDDGGQQWYAIDKDEKNAG